jgi:DNA (cytosine-5)-methyltransferase 1
MIRPLLLDLFCGSGGAAMGYYQAGYDVLGVDHVRQPRYPFDFVKSDVFDFLESYNYQHVSAIHASAPCQRYSRMTNCWPGLKRHYPNHVAPVRKVLRDIGLPYVLENVEEAFLHRPIVLCGRMFGLDLYRHRLFESNIDLAPRRHPRHIKPASKAGHWQPGTIMSVAGHVAPMSEAKKAMGIDWMTRDQLVESIPPAYTKYIGRQLIIHG